MKFLVFETEEAAFLAQLQITQNMRLMEPEFWGPATLRQDGKITVKKPQEQHMSGVTGYTEE